VPAWSPWVSAAVFLALLAASVGFVWAFYSPRHERWARVALAAALALAVLELVLLALRSSSFPVVTPGSLADFLVCMVAGAFFLWVRHEGWGTVAGFVAPGLTLLWLVGQLVSPPVPAHLALPLTGFWLAVHVSLATASYAAFLLGAAAAGMYLEHERELLTKVPRVFYYRLPPLAATDLCSYRLVALGFALLTGTIATGMLWSQMMFGVAWSWTAKETWTLGVWAVYGTYLVMRLAGWRGHRAAWLSVGAFAAVVANLVGVVGPWHGLVR
jgi:ABC-type transport system involved in cytochrome c biogenesis permease subunit